MEQLLNIGSMQGLGSNEPVGNPSPEVEAAPPAAPAQAPETQKEGLASPRLAALAAKERAYLQKRIEMKRYDAQLKQRETLVKEFEALKANARRNPLETIKSLGIDYSDLTNFVLNGGKPTPELEIGAVKNELEQFKQQQIQREETQAKQAIERAKAEEQEVLNDYQEGINHFVSTNSSEYKLINAYDAQEMIRATTQEHFERTKKSGSPKILSMKEAADLVEGYLRDEISKGHSLLQPPQVEQDPVQQRSSSKTLNNQMISSAPSLLSPAKENDRMRRALARLG